MLALGNILSPGGSGVSLSVPAPLRGLNTRESFTQLGFDEARALENWLPDTGACRCRPGHADHCQISGATQVPSLSTFRGASSTQLIAGAGGKVYNVTSSTAINLVGSTTYTSNRWITEVFNGWMFGVNGTDTPWRYDGTTHQATGFSGSGLTLANLETVGLIRNRLWFTEKNSADVWYGGAAAVTGTLTKFQLSQFAAGKCVGLGSWSRDAGDGMDDYAVFIMSSGEVFVYQGDPQTTFSLVGKYMAPAPIAINPSLRVGGERVLLTVNGPVPISAVLGGSAFDPSALQVWGKIAPSWQNDARLNRSNYGWIGHYFNGICYFNVPGAATSKQYVLNTRNGSWTTYTGLPVADFADLDGTLYFGSIDDGYVYSHTTGTDDGADIVTLARQGFSFPAGADRSKQFTMIRPKIVANGNAQGQFQIDVDFKESPVDVPVVNLIFGASGTQWGDPWGGAWSSAASAVDQWLSIYGYGRAVAPVVRTYSKADELLWYSSDIIGIGGGYL